MKGLSNLDRRRMDILLLSNWVWNPFSSNCMDIRLRLICLCLSCRLSQLIMCLILLSLTMKDSLCWTLLDSYQWCSGDDSIPFKWNTLELRCCTVNYIMLSLVYRVQYMLLLRVNCNSLRLNWMLRNIDKWFFVNSYFLIHNYWAIGLMTGTWCCRKYLS